MMADELGVDWRLAPAIAVWESSAGRAACGGNAWGIGSCAEGYRYETWADGVKAAVTLLASPLYAGLGTMAALCRWVSGDAGCGSEHSQAYAGRVMATMAGMGPR